MQATRGYVRHPSIYDDRIVFVCEEDLWVVAAAGGASTRLTAGLGESSSPRFSPDGSLVAFVGHEEGPGDVYVVPAAGGAVTRLTFHARPRRIASWTPDSSGIHYASSVGCPDPYESWLHRVPAAGGLPERLPLGPGSAIENGPGGGLLLGRHSQIEPAVWKRYRGGGMGTIWIDAGGTGTFRELVRLPGNLACPCWIGPRVYFLSDHEGYGNVYSCTVDGEDVQRHTDHDDFYARGLSGDGRRLVYHAGGDLYLLEPDAAGPRRLEVELVTSRTQRQRRFVPAGRGLERAALSSDASVLALTTRGQAFTLGCSRGAVLRHGDRDGVRHRLVTWLSDGRRLLAARSGEDDEREQLVILAGDGSTAGRLLDLDVGRPTLLEVAPGRDLAAVANHRNALLLVDLRGDEPALRTVDHSVYGPVRGLAWSPDGRWLAYGHHGTRETCAIKVYDVQTGVTHAVTRPVLWDYEPAFDPDGNYLYFIGRHWRDAVYDEIHVDMDLPRACRPHAVCLRRDVPSPLDGRPEPRSVVDIDLDGIEDRVVPLPVPPGRYRRVRGGRGCVLFLSLPLWGAPWRVLLGTPTPAGALERWRPGRPAAERLADDVEDLWVSRDGGHLAYRAKDRLRVLETGAEAPGPDTGWVDLDRVRVSVDPPSEWRQLFREAWRLQRENALDETLWGVEWGLAYRRYQPLLDRIATRTELSDLVDELQGELGVSHARELDAEGRRPPSAAQGFLGVDWEFDAGAAAYLVAGIVRGDTWDAESSSPLLRPGVDVQPGDHVLAVNGQRLDATLTPAAALVGQAGAEVQLTVQRPGGAPREVTVRTIRDESGGRYRDWAESNRQAVLRASGGRVGYLHLPDFWGTGFTVFHRGFLAEYDRDALIVDVRGNSGGHVSTVLLEKLSRRRLGYGVIRQGVPEPFPPHSPAGPLVCLTNSSAGSDGDVFSQCFKLLRLGPLVGTRTWGGATGISHTVHHRLVDGSHTMQPHLVFFFDEIGWGLENGGAEPDVVVENAPHDYARGADPQLERAVEVALARLERCPTHRPRPTPPPSLRRPPLPPRADRA